MARTSQNDTHLPIESRVPVVELQGGIYTNYPVVINNSLSYQEAIGGSLATNTTLTAAESGSTYLLSHAAGLTVTLPTPSEGLTFTFVVTTSVTSNAYKIYTGSASVFLQGIDVIGNGTAADTNVFTGNGTSHTYFNMNGSTTGGLLGTQVTFTALSSTLWQVDAQNYGSGTVATSFATS